MLVTIRAMKKICFSVLCCLWVFTLIGQGFDPLDELVEAEKATWIRKHPVASDHNLQASADNRSDVQYCRLRWTVDPAIKYIRGEVMTVFEPVETLESLEFDFSETLTMDSILFHGQPLSFAHNGNVLTVQFPTALPAFLADSLTFFYQGAPTSTGFGSFEVNSHNGTPVLWTLSEPYGAMEWWPCKQSLTDKIDSVDIFIRNPVGYRAASNGLLQSEITENGWTTAHWRHRYAIPAYLIGIAVTNYEVFTVLAPYGTDTTQIVNYVYPESLDNAQIGVAQNVAVMQLFNELFGLYPFHAEKYGHAQFGWGGGIEHQTMSFVGTFSYALLAHELAHQWFGDKVTCASWGDIWLNEGFATYLTGLCYDFLQPEYWEIYKAHHIGKSTEKPGGSVFVYDTSSVSQIFSSQMSYSKGAMLLHMLRWKMGDTIFFKGLRNYVNDPALEFGYASTADLKAHLEAAYGQDLSEFFADWLYGQGYPSYDIQWSKDQFNDVKISIQQTTSHPSVSFFEMPVAVKLTDGIQDTTLVLQHTSSGQSFTASLGFKPTELVFDPDMWLVSRNNIVQEVAPDGSPLPIVSISIQPNPAKSDFSIQLKVVDNDPVRLTLWAADGKLLLEKRIETIPGLNEIPIGNRQLPAGRYLVRLESKKWQVERAVVKL